MNMLPRFPCLLALEGAAGVRYLSWSFNSLPALCLIMIIEQDNTILL